MSGSITIRLSELGIPENQDRAVDSNVSETILSDEALIAEVCLGGREALAILFRRYARVRPRSGLASPEGRSRSR